MCVCGAHSRENRWSYTLSDLVPQKQTKKWRQLDNEFCYVPCVLREFCIHNLLTYSEDPGKGKDMESV